MTTPASPLDPDVAMYRAEKARLAPKFARRKKKMQAAIARIIAREEEMYRAAQKRGRPVRGAIFTRRGPRKSERAQTC